MADARIFLQAATCGHTEDFRGVLQMPHMWGFTKIEVKDTSSPGTP